MRGISRTLQIVAALLALFALSSTFQSPTIESFFDSAQVHDMRTVEEQVSRNEA